MDDLEIFFEIKQRKPVNKEELHQVVDEFHKEYEDWCNKQWEKEQEAYYAAMETRNEELKEFVSGGHSPEDFQ